MKPTIKTTFILAILLLLPFMQSSCSSDETFSNPPPTKPSEPENTGDYELVWEENFEGTKLNTNIWNVELVKNPANNEYQEYKAENISLGQEPTSKKNCLIITAKKETSGSRFYTSGRLNTMKKAAFKYGRIDASIKLPKTGNGLWPAFWMKGNDNDVAVWPSCGEIDIMEMGHVDGISKKVADRYHGAACHWGPSNALLKSVGKKSTLNYSLQDDKFHLYTLIWDDQFIRVYVDLDQNPKQQPLFEFNHKNNENQASKFFNKEFYILLNLAVGGDYTGIKGNDNIDKITALNAANNYEAKMYVDFIKVYQRGKGVAE